MWIWYGYLQQVIIPFLKSCHEIWLDFLNYPLNFCPVGGYREHDSNSEDSESEDSESENGLDIVSEEKKDKTQIHKEVKPARDKKPYISVSQFLINGVLQRSVENVSNKSFLDEWIIVDKNIETNSSKKIN